MKTDNTDTSSLNDIKNRLRELSIQVDKLSKLYEAVNSPGLVTATSFPKAMKITPKEREVIYLSSIGKTYKEIADTLGVRTTTIKFHMRNIVIKLGVCNSRQAIRHAVEMKLVEH
ncbi:helix-turn-helix transcriptional regulator [Rouxiella silvae]|uniref:Helix-turn-helix transcriptional regulator n=1 Tax=Rouxiella silvae TaxID=1646373 RepID=A0AA40X590_9GAMM|nr:helix-turn-helix transcriptional regulator [Rouxiella silvae]MBF6638828.1 helix-turn-helix transcriptional regulator [Rouxiella silvae]